MMTGVDVIKNFLSQMIQNYFTDLADITAPPDIADVATVDSFSADKEGGEENGTVEKLGIDKKAARAVAKASDLRGEIVKEADKGKIYEKLMKDGHVGDTHAAEKELQFILEDLETGQAQNQRTVSNPLTQPVASPIQAMLGEIHDTLMPLLDDEPEPERQHAESQDDGENEDEAEEHAAEETNISLQAKSHYQKMNSFA